MTKRAHITIDLISEASDVSTIQIVNKIRKEANIPWCKDIIKVAIEDDDTTFENWKKHGISKNVAHNLLDLYTK